MLTRITLPSRQGGRARGDDFTQRTPRGRVTQREMPRTPTPVGRAARGLSIDVPDARRPAPTGGGMGASLCASPRLSVLCVKRLSELRPLSVQSATQVDHLISIGLLSRPDL